MSTMPDNAILLVDDEPELLAVCREALEEQGYNVRCAPNGRVALELLQAQPVALVITDLSMPGVDGMALFDAIQSRRLDLDVIFLTGHGTVDNAVECLKRGAADYLLKPFDLRSLLTKVEEVMAQRRRRRQEHGPGTLFSVFALTSALSRQPDLRSLLREFLAQLREAFAPDGVALLLTSQQPDQTLGSLKPAIYWGRIFAHFPDLKPWLNRLGASALAGNSWRMIGPNGQGKSSGRPANLSSLTMLAAPIIFGPFRTGAVCLVRDASRPGFSDKETQLLASLATHAASSIENLRASRRLSSLSMNLVTSYVKAVEAKDVYTRGHSERVSSYGVLLGQRLGLPEGELERLRIAGMLHDVGKIGIPDSILNKPSTLSREEFEIMKRHPAVGENILARIDPLKEVLPIIYHHHEWYDGSGYPEGLAGEDIPYLARIIAVVDGFEAMTSDRAYHRAMPAEAARRVLAAGAGRQWDPEALAAWFDVLDEKDSLHETSLIAPAPLAFAPGSA